MLTHIKTRLTSSEADPAIPLHLALASELAVVPAASRLLGLASVPSMMSGLPACSPPPPAYVWRLCRPAQGPCRIEKRPSSIVS